MSRAAVVGRRIHKKVPLVVGAVFFTLVVPGTVTILVPHMILRSSVVQTWPEFSTVQFLATLMGVIGAAILVHSIWVFAFYLIAIPVALPDKPLHVTEGSPVMAGNTLVTLGTIWTRGEAGDR